MLRQRQLLRQLSLLRSLKLSQRRYSTELSVREKLLKLKESKDIPPSVYSNLLNHNDIITGKEVEIVDEIIDLAKNDSNVTNESRVQLHNFVLKNLVKYDYSLSVVHQRELSDLKGVVDLDSMVEIIKYNPGRVKSSWELFETTMSTIERDSSEEYQELLSTVLSKLVHGDASEQEDGYIMNETALLRSVFLLKCLKAPSQDLLEKVLARALETDNYQLIQLIGLQSFEQIKNLEPNTNQFVQLWSIWNPSPSSLSKEEIENNLDLWKKLLWRTSEKKESTSPKDNSSHQESFSYLKQLQEQFPKLQVDLNIPKRTDQDSTFQSLVNILEESGIFKNPEPKYTPLRVTLLKSYGMNKDNIKTAFQLYHDFISLDKQNVDLYMTTMATSSFYLAVKDNDSRHLMIGEALIPQPIPYKALQGQILGYSSFDIQKSLDLFNDHIKNVSKKVNELGTSPATSLIESLITSYLSKKDLQFAHLIHDGAIMNNIITTETAKNRMKAIFKKYGEIIGEEDNDKMAVMLKDQVLESLREL